MIVTPRIAVRIALILILAVVLQVSFFSYLSIFGATPNIVPVVVVSLGLLGGARRGRGVRLRRRPAAGLGAAADARRLLAGRCCDRLPGRPLPRGHRDHRARSSRRCSSARFTLLALGRLRGDRADARRRRPGEPAGRARDRRPGPAGRAPRLPVYPLDPPDPAPGARRRRARRRARRLLLGGRRRRGARRGGGVIGGRRPGADGASTEARARDVPTGAARRSPPSSPSGSRSSAASPWSCSRSSSSASGTCRCSPATST